MDDLLYTNEFINNEPLVPATRTIKAKWRDYIDTKKEQQRKEIEVKQSKKIPTDILIDDLTLTNGISKETPQQLSKQRYNKPRRSVITIDSRDRDKLEYLNPNYYIINFNKTFENVKSIKMISSEFPNTNQVIKGSPVELATNIVYWINQEDVGVYPIQPIYSTELTPGNYYSSSLTTEMEAKMNAVKRNNGTGSYHNFEVSINTDTDIVDICSFDTTVLNNPLKIYGDQIVAISDLAGSMNIVTQDSPHNLIPGDLVFIQAVRTLPDINGQRTVRTITGSDSFTVDNGVGSDVAFIASSDATNMFFSSNIIQVNQPGHSYVTSDTVIISNATAFDGLTTTVINGEHIVRGSPGVTVDKYYLTFSIAGTSLVTGGGTAVKISTPLPFKFLFSNLDSPGEILGYNQEDSSETSGGYITDIVAGSPVTVTSASHSLQANDIVTITGTNTIPSINGNHTVSSIIDSNTFTLNLNVSRIVSSDFSNAYVSFSPFTTVNYSVTDFDPVTNTVTTGSAHNLSVGDYLTLFNTFTAPLINGHSFLVTAVPSATEATIDLTPIGKEYSVGNNSVVVKSLNGASCAVNRLNFHLVDHSLNVGDTIYIYDAEKFAGLSSDYINTVHGKMNDFSSNQLKQPVGKSDSVQKEKRNTVILDSELTTTRFVKSVTDANNFVIDISRSPLINTTERGGGNSVSISSALFISPTRTVSFTEPVNNLFGFNYCQQNVTSHGLLNRNVSLEGESYILMLSKILSTMDNSGPVTNIFAKILLSDPPGTILFNTFVSNECVFDDNALPSINNLEIAFVDKKGHLFDFTGVDHSFSLEIIEYVDYLADSGISSRRGVDDRGLTNLNAETLDPVIINQTRSRNVVDKPVKSGPKPF